MRKLKIYLIIIGSLFIINLSMADTNIGGRGGNGSPGGNGYINGGHGGNGGPGGNAGASHSESKGSNNGNNNASGNGLGIKKFVILINSIPLFGENGKDGIRGIDNLN